MQRGQVVNSEYELSGFTCNTDLFCGEGNPTWTLKSVGDTYFVRMDIFSGELYACPTGAYPEVIYLDGWSIGPNSDKSIVWDAENVIPLVRNGSKYEGTFYNFGWGGDIKFYLTWPGTGTSVVLPSSNFGSNEYLNPNGGDGSFTIPGGTGYFKVVVDLKDGVSISSNGTVSNKGKQTFSLDYAAQ